MGVQWPENGPHRATAQYLMGGIIGIACGTLLAYTPDRVSPWIAVRLPVTVPTALVLMYAIVAMVPLWRDRVRETQEYHVSGVLSNRGLFEVAVMVTAVLSLMIGHSSSFLYERWCASTPDLSRAQHAMLCSSALAVVFLLATVVTVRDPYPAKRHHAFAGVLFVTMYVLAISAELHLHQCTGLERSLVTITAVACGTLAALVAPFVVRCYTTPEAFRKCVRTRALGTLEVLLFSTTSLAYMDVLTRGL